MKLFLIALLLALPLVGKSQQLGVHAVGFYNVENLFDCTPDYTVREGHEEFTPEGPYRWTPEKYRKKLENIASVIDKLGTAHSPAGLALLGLAEVENRQVLEELVAVEKIAARGYKIVHTDSPDRRGIDVALLYNPALFSLNSSSTHRFDYPADSAYVTRDLLLVSGQMAGETLHAIVCHWPSRYGGAKSASLRQRAAELCLHLVDSLHTADPLSKVILMGDLNDDPTDKSCREVLGAKRTAAEVAEGGLLNTSWRLFDRGIGSLGYQGKWNLFDQAIVSHSALGEEYSTLRWWRTEVFNPDFLTATEGRYKGYPLRTFSGNTFQNGYSDHYPIVVYFVKRR